MTDLVIFNILTPLTNHFTGALHSPSKFDRWVATAVEKFGGLTVLGLGLKGYWYDADLPPRANPVRDRSNAYKMGVPPARIDDLRGYVRQTARDFGQKFIYFERAGEAEFVRAPEPPFLRISLHL